MKALSFFVKAAALNENVFIKESKAAKNENVFTTKSLDKQRLLWYNSSIRR